MRVAHRLIGGSLLNIVGLVLSVIISFFMMPFMISSLGDRWYGVWTLVAEFLWYYGLLDFGLSSAVGRFLSQSVGRNDEEEIRHITSTAFYLTLILALIAVVATIIMILVAPVVVESKESLRVFRLLLIIMGINFAIEFPVRVFNAVLGANLRFDLSTLISIIKNIAIAVMVIFVLKSGYGVVAVGVVSVLGSLGDNLARIYFAFRVEKNLSLSLDDYVKARVRKLLDYSVYIFVGKIADVFRFKIDLFVISAFVKVDAVTHYFIGARLIDYFMQFMRTVIEVIGPVFSRDEGRKDFVAIRRNFLFVTKISTYLAVFFGGLGLLFGKPFIHRWVGPEYMDGYYVLLVLIIPGIFALLQNPSDHLLNNISEHKYIAGASFLEGIFNLILSLIFVTRFGLVGVALGTAIPMTIRYLLEPLYS